MCCNFFLSAGVQVLRSVCISSSVFTMLKSVSVLVLLSSEVVICEVTGTVVITILNKKCLKLIESYVQNNITLKVNLIIYHKHSGNTNPVCILVQHFFLFTMGYKMVSSMAISIVYRCFINQENYRWPHLQFFYYVFHIRQHLQG